MARRLLDAGINCMLVLNPSRQIVAASTNLGEIAHGISLDEYLGSRFGEALGCVHSHECADGCGTTEYCRDCGALRATLAGLAGEQARQECRITRKVTDGFESLDLDVLATPFEIDGERYTIVAIADLSHEKRRRALERIFYHDVINLAGGLEGMIGNLRSSVPVDLTEEVELSYTMTRELIEEIVAQRDLAAAERAELEAHPSMINSLVLLKRIAATYSSHPVCELRSVVVDEESDSIEFVTDVTLLTRVLGNLVKNAGEASAIGQTVSLGCRLGGAKIVFSVHNNAVMERSVQHQVFQRSFSTKGAGRGLGTYSVKLLVEKCLEGIVTFESTQEQGTTFRVTLPLVLQ